MKILRKQSRLIFIFILFFLCHFEVSAFNINISDPIVHKKAKPGEAITGVLQLSNPSQQDVKVKAYLEDFTYVDPFNGSKKFSPAGSTKHSCANWIRFTPQDFTLAAYSQKNIDYSIQIPQDAQGGYEAVLFFETALGTTEPKAGYILEVMGRVGALFFVETEGSIKEAKIDFKVDGASLKGTFLNSGQVFIKSQGTYYIIDSEGLVLDRGTLENLYTLPGDKAKFSIQPSKDISAPSYTLVCTFDLQDGDVAVKEVDIDRDPTGNLKIIKITD